MLYWYSLIFLLFPTPSQQPPKERWSQIYTQFRPSVYLIQCGTKKGVGFLYKDNKHVLSTLSVAGCGRTIYLTTKPGGKTVEVQLHAYISKHDIALLTSPKPLPGKAIQPSPNPPLVGKRVALIGHPYKTDGILANATKQILSWNLGLGVVGQNTKHYLQVQMLHPFGFAGSPVLDKDGHFLGMMTSKKNRGKSLGIVARPKLLQKLFAPTPPREGWPYFSWDIHVFARFSFALGDSDNTNIVPTNQELRLDLIFWDQLMLGLFVGFDFLAVRADLDLSLLGGATLSYRFLIPRQVRPYLNYISLGVGIMTMHVKLLAFQKDKKDAPLAEQYKFDTFFRGTLWSGIHISSMFGEFSVGVFFELSNLTNPVLSFGWGL